MNSDQEYTEAEALSAIDRLHNRGWCLYCGGGPATNEAAMLLRDYVAQASKRRERLDKIDLSEAIKNEWLGNPGSGNA